jgi:hypothetical protein
MPLYQAQLIDCRHPEMSTRDLGFVTGTIPEEAADEALSAAGPDGIDGNLIVLRGALGEKGYLFAIERKNS